jgi:cysteine desulfurase
MTRRPIYLDCHATTPVDPRVAEAMWPYFVEAFGNAASINHAYGHEAATAVESARAEVGRLIGAPAESLVFTSGATEADNLALKGVLWASRPGAHLVTSLAEHRAVLDPAKRLQREGYGVTCVPVDAHGRVDPQSIAEAIRPETVLVSIMAANNEVGTINPVAEIGRICRERGVLFHCDAAQAVGRIPVNVDEWGVDLLSLAAHKLYGPKGVGGLYVRRGERRIRLEPLFDGGGHEGRLRSGTLPVPLIVGLGRACKLLLEPSEELNPGCHAVTPEAGRHGSDGHADPAIAVTACHPVLEVEAMKIGALRDQLELHLLAIPGVTRNGHPTERLPGNLHVSVAGLDGDVLMNALTGIAISSGAACTTAEPEPSHVLRAMGVPDRLARSSLRFGLGRFTTSEEMEFVAQYVTETVQRLRGR